MFFNPELCQENRVHQGVWSGQCCLPRGVTEQAFIFKTHCLAIQLHPKIPMGVFPAEHSVTVITGYVSAVVRLESRLQLQ